MKLLLATIFIIFLLLLSSCENGVVLSYNPDELGSARFVKAEKVKNNELDCNYGEASHKHVQGDTYYIYFTLSSSNSTPINPENPKFSDIQKSMQITFEKKDASGNYVSDSAIQVDKNSIEFLKFGKNLNNRQNFNFLIDLYEESCLQSSDPNLCALSGGLNFNNFKDMVNKISTALVNLYYNYTSETANFIEDDFLGVKYFAMSVADSDSSSAYTKEMTSTYLTDMGDVQGSLNEPKNRKKIRGWLEANDGGSYLDLKNSYSKYHRKLFDGFIEVAENIKGDSHKNKSLVLITAGYDESYYDTTSGLEQGNKSSHSEDDFFNALTFDDNIQVFIVPEDRSDKKSFPDETGEEIDNKFYKLACLTNGAYYPYLYRESDNAWKPVKPSDFSAKMVIGNIKEASYGMWRVKITLDEATTDSRYYEGGFKVSVKGVMGDDITTQMIGYRIVR